MVPLGGAGTGNGVTGSPRGRGVMGGSGAGGFGGMTTLPDESTVGHGGSKHGIGFGAGGGFGFVAGGGGGGGGLGRVFTGTGAGAGLGFTATGAVRTTAPGEAGFRMGLRMFTGVSA